MKQNIILWLGTLIIVFLAGYLNNVTDSDYPVSGTIGVSGEKVSYNFVKKYYTNTPCPVVIRSDIKADDGYLLWRYNGGNEWKRIKMTQKGDIISAKLPVFNVNSHIAYKAVIIKNNKSYDLPPGNTVPLHFTGKIPSTILVLYYLTLFGGIILSVRTGLEYFKEGGHVRRYSLFTLMCFFLYISVVPVKYTFEIDYITTKAVPFITSLFDIKSLLLFLLSTAGMAVAFKSSSPKLKTLIISCITLLVFIIL
jgi:hypothetical protein